MTQSFERFSFRTRQRCLDQMPDALFDVLVIGGGITGAATARDAASRGLKVALVEKNDFASGTSSRSSKLIHGGLRYLENREFGLVFEALGERTFLLKTAGNRVRPLPFYFPVYRSDPHGMNILSLGFWLYDLLALFRSPGFHRRLSQSRLLNDVPSLKKDQLVGGFRYFDASMWDDGLTVETLRSAQEMSVSVVNQVEAIRPLWVDGKIRGFEVQDRAHPDRPPFVVHAHKVVICVGPWTDHLGRTLSEHWEPWLRPSQGTHLVFDLRRIPVPGAVVMSHPKDGRISFVMPRPDFGTGVTIVGTTDGPAPAHPEKVMTSPEEVRYLMDLLDRYFPDLHLKTSDILSHYVGIRPLFGGGASAASLQKVSREHFIGEGPGGTTLVAGGKYTTARNMAEQVMDFCIDHWREEVRQSGRGYFPNGLGSSETRVPINPSALSEAVAAARALASKFGLTVPERLFELYGADALEIMELARQYPAELKETEGFPELEAVFRWSLRNEMVLHLEDFYFRRTALYLARRDHGLPWLNRLAEIWAEELGVALAGREHEKQRLLEQIEVCKVGGT